MLNQARKIDERDLHKVYRPSIFWYRILVAHYVGLTCVMEFCESLLDSLWAFVLGFIWGVLVLFTARASVPNGVRFEEKWWSFGQVLPLVLLVLPMLAVLEHFVRDNKKNELSEQIREIPLSIVHDRLGVLNHTTGRQSSCQGVDSKTTLLPISDEPVADDTAHPETGSSIVDADAANNHIESSGESGPFAAPRSDYYVQIPQKYPVCQHTKPKWPFRQVSVRIEVFHIFARLDQHLSSWWRACSVLTTRISHKVPETWLLGLCLYQRHPLEAHRIFYRGRGGLVDYLDDFGHFHQQKAFQIMNATCTL